VKTSLPIAEGEEYSMEGAGISVVSLETAVTVRACCSPVRPVDIPLKLTVTGPESLTRIMLLRGSNVGGELTVFVGPSALAGAEVTLNTRVTVEFVDCPSLTVTLTVEEPLAFWETVNVSVASASGLV
jgi:hypothetical protein